VPRSKTFITHLNKGPSAARVERVERRDEDVKEGEAGFATRD